MIAFSLAMRLLGLLTVGVVQLDQVTRKVKIQAAEQDARHRTTAGVHKSPACCSALGLKACLKLVYHGQTKVTNVTESEATIRATIS